MDSSRRSSKSFLDFLFNDFISPIFKAFVKADKINRKAKEKENKSQIRAQRTLKQNADKFKSKEYLFNKYKTEILSKVPLKTEDAIRIYRRFLKDEGDCDYQFEITQAIDDFKEQIKHERDCLEDHEYYIEYVQGLKDEIKELREQLKICDPDEKEDLRDEIDCLIEQIEDEHVLHQKDKLELKKFRSDKSEFLIGCIKGSVYGYEKKAPSESL